MDWVKLAVRYYADPSIEHLDDAAELMFVRGLARAGELGSGGVIPESSLPLLARRRRYDKLVNALVAEGLWTRVDGGYRITRWSDWQDAADALAARRTAERERQRRRRDRLSRDTKSPGLVDNSSSGAVTHVQSKKGKPRSDTLSRDASRDVTHTEGEGDLDTGLLGEGESPGQRARASPPPRFRCSRHKNLPDDDPGPNCTACRDVRLAAEKTAEKQDKPPPRPPHCGQCDPENRMVETDTGAQRRCPRCHPGANP